MSLLDLNSGKGSSPRMKRGVKLWVGAGLVAAVVGIGSTLASSITINSGDTTEFGQGVQRTVYCGSEAQTLKVIPVSSYKNKSGSVDPAGTFYMTGVRVESIPTASDGMNFVISLYDTTAGSSVLPIVSTSSLTLSTPTVYWRSNVSSSTNTYSGPSSTSASGESSSCQAASINKLASNGSGALLSASRTSFVNPCSVAYLTVKSNAFQVNFKSGGSITNADTGATGRIVIETQEDTFGSASTKANGNAYAYGLAYDGLS
jgi:hypothetical protein